MCEIAEYRFRLRVACGYLPTPVFVANRKRKTPSDQCPNCLSHEPPNAKHILLECDQSENPALNVDVMTNDLLRSANRTLITAGLVPRAFVSRNPTIFQSVARFNAIELWSQLFAKVWKPYNAKIAEVLPNENVPPDLTAATRPNKCLLCQSQAANCGCPVHNRDSLTRRLSNIRRTAPPSFRHFIKNLWVPYKLAGWCKKPTTTSDS
jgi:hypothetical protein